MSSHARHRIVDLERLLTKRMPEIVERIGRGAVAQRLADEIRRDHPGWSWLQVAREARRQAGLPELGAEWCR